MSEHRFGACVVCGGSLTADHQCPMRATSAEQPTVPNLRLSQIIRVYAAATSIDNKELAGMWDCSESTVSRFLAGKGLPDGSTMTRIISWLIAG